MKTLAPILAGTVLGLVIAGTVAYIAMTYTDDILEYL